MATEVSVSKMLDILAEVYNMEGEFIHSFTRAMDDGLSVEEAILFGLDEWDLPHSIIQQAIQPGVPD